jgi:nitroreductase
MDLFDAIEKRHSYRGPFTTAPVLREDLQAIVMAGIQAPSAKNEQTTSFVIVDDPLKLEQIDEILARTVDQKAKAMIVCATDPRPVLGELSFHAEDCAAAVENMLLAITTLGYATVWLDGVIRFGDRARRIADLLGVPKGKQVRVILPIGVPAESVAQREKLPFQQRAWFNRHGG